MTYAVCCLLYGILVPIYLSVRGTDYLDCPTEIQGWSAGASAIRAWQAPAGRYKAKRSLSPTPASSFHPFNILPHGARLAVMLDNRRIQLQFHPRQMSHLLRAGLPTSLFPCGSATTLQSAWDLWYSMARAGWMALCNRRNGNHFSRWGREKCRFIQGPLLVPIRTWC